MGVGGGGGAKRGGRKDKGRGGGMAGGWGGGGMTKEEKRSALRGALEGVAPLLSAVVGRCVLASIVGLFCLYSRSNSPL
jgi:hypothetical protein